MKVITDVKLGETIKLKEVLVYVSLIPYKQAILLTSILISPSPPLHCPMNPHLQSSPILCFYTYTLTLHFLHEPNVHAVCCRVPNHRRLSVLLLKLALNVFVLFERYDIYIPQILTNTPPPWPLGRLGLYH